MTDERPPSTPRPPRSGLLAVVGPGILIAATGVGAGDLATAGYAGALLGVAVAWAVIIGAVAKLVLTEAIARWQLGTGEEFLSGALKSLGPVVSVGLLLYFLPWTLFTGAALVRASSASSLAVAGATDPSPTTVWLVGAIHSVAALIAVSFGSFRRFEQLMTVCIGVMFLGVLIAAAPAAWALGPELVRGLVIPTIPDLAGDGAVWTIALMGGVGGTVTILCYGPWIREQGRTTPQDIRVCRIDLAFGYAATGLFGIAMLVLAASSAQADGRGVALIVSLADGLEARLGPAGRLVFLIGAWAAIVSSVLGVWQAVPLLFREILRGLGVASERTLHRSTIAYRVALALGPLAIVQLSFKEALKWYAVVGAAFVPLLALALLILLTRDRERLGPLRAGPLTLGALAIALALGLLAGGFDIARRF